jgi:hypothetical protein
MFWLTWRQHRWQIIGIAAVLIAYCGYLAYAGLDAQKILHGCSFYSEAPISQSCTDAENSVLDKYSLVQEILIFGNLLPVLAGMFWGAPLIAREVEQGTYRLAFMQTVTRRRWLAVKLGVLAGTAAFFGSIIGVVVPWTLRQFEPLMATRPFGNDQASGQAGAVSAAIWIFALLFGATAGLLLRRAMTAVAVSMALLPLAIVGLVFLRPHYLPPVTTVVGGNEMISDSGGFEKNDARGLVINLSYQTPDGQKLTSETAGKWCADPQNTFPSPKCLNGKGLKQIIVYHPLSQYPWFQLVETALLLTLSGAAVLFIRRRITNRIV